MSSGVFDSKQKHLHRLSFYMALSHRCQGLIVHKAEQLSRSEQRKYETHWDKEVHRKHPPGVSPYYINGGKQ